MFHPDGHKGSLPQELTTHVCWSTPGPGWFSQDGNLFGGGGSRRPLPCSCFVVLSCTEMEELNKEIEQNQIKASSSQLELFLLNLKMSFQRGNQTSLKHEGQEMTTLTREKATEKK